MAQLALGIDLGHAEVKLVQIRRRRRAHRVERAVRVPVPAQAIASGRIEARQSLCDAIRPALRPLRERPGRSVVGMKSPEFVVRTLNLPRVPGPELREAARWEMVDLLQVPHDQADDLVVDCEVLEQLPGGGEARVGVVAARRSVVGEVVKLLRELRLPPEVLEVNAFAVQRAARRPGRVCYLDVGAAYTEVYVTEDGRLVLYRLLPLGADRITVPVEGSLGASREQAEGTKRAEAPGTLLERSTGHPALHATAQTLLDALAQTLEYVRVQQGQADGGIESIVLAGGGALQRGLVTLLKEALGYPVELADPFAGLELGAQAEDVAQQGLAPLFAAAVGLALRGAEGA